MSEEITLKPGESGKDGEHPALKTYTDEEVKALKDSAAAAARREAEAKLKELQERLNAFEAREKEREEAEMTELDKQKKKIEELNKEIFDLKPFKLEVEKIRAEMAEEADKEMESLTETQKTALADITDPKTKLRIINEIKAASTADRRNIPSNKGGNVTGAPELEDIFKMRDAGDKRWLEAYKKYKIEKGI